ncbi:MAG: acyloxyacyl hydrolase [Proteobacteria bacterium]|nr:acyloxyacyl hydrolase [Pseudomonadota bacterium]
MFLVIRNTFPFGVLLLLLIGTAKADLGVAFGSGQGIQDIKPYRLAVSWDFGPIWHEEAMWGLNAAWESSVAIWDGPQRPTLSPDRAIKLNAFTSGPMFRWQRQQSFTRNHIIPYTELGVGLSWLSETEIQGRVLSLHFQFEDKVGFGFRFGKHPQFDIAMRAYHYSNCSIKRPNSGVNLAMASIGVWFTK